MLRFQTTLRGLSLADLPGSGLSKSEPHRETRFVSDARAVDSVQVIAEYPVSGDAPRFDLGADGAGVRHVLDYLGSSLADPPRTRQLATVPTGFESCFPSNTQDYIALPFYAMSSPLFMIIALSTEGQPRFKESDETAMSTFGSILRAQAAQADMKSTDRAKTAFLSSISHELRTPMHGIITSLRLLRTAAVAGDLGEVSMLAKIAESSGQTLQRLLNDVLDFDSLRTSGGNEKRIDLASIAEEMISTCALQRYQGSAPVELVLEHEDRPWQAVIDEAGYQRYVGRAESIRGVDVVSPCSCAVVRILINGITNAMKFTHNGSITLKLALDETQSRVVIRIVDTGIGISPEFASRMYEPFTKSNAFSVGAGLGLHITKTLVERMSGTVALRPNKGQNGSTFEVVLPIKSMDKMSIAPMRMKRKLIHTCLDEPGDLGPERLGASEECASRSGGGLDKTRLRVLVVDDNLVNRKLLSLTVKKCPCAPIIQEAADGQQAIDRYDTFRPHLIFTDVSMPVLDGLTATTKIRQLEQDRGDVPPCTIYALTGLGSSDVRLRLDSLMGKASLNGWLVKGEHDMSVITSIVEEAAKRIKTK